MLTEHDENSTQARTDRPPRDTAFAFYPLHRRLQRHQSVKSLGRIVRQILWRSERVSDREFLRKESGRRARTKIIVAIRGDREFESLFLLRRVINEPQGKVTAEAVAIAPAALR